MSMSEIIQAEATTLDQDIAKAQAEFAAIQLRIEGKLADYANVEITDDESYKAAKKYRADLNALKKEIDDARKLVTSGYRNKIDEFNQSVKELTEPLEQRQAEIGRMAGEWEGKKQRERYDTLRSAYESQFPALAEIVPFDTIDAHHRSGESSWYAAKVSGGKALAILADHVDQIGRDEAAIDALQLDDAERTQLKADYFECLDFAGAVTRSEERRLKAQAEEAKRFQVAQLEQARQAAQEAARQPQQAETVPQEPQAPTAVAESLTEAQAATTYIITATMTPQQRTRLIAALQEMNVKGRCSNLGRDLPESAQKAIHLQAKLTKREEQHAS